MQGSDQQLKNVSNLWLTTAKNYETSTKWKVRDEKPLLYLEQEVDGRKVVKAENVINLPFDMVLKFFQNPSSMTVCNKDSLEKLQTLYQNKKDEFRVLRMKMKMPGPVSDRQACVVNTVKIQGSKAYIGNKSCNYNFKEDEGSEIAHIHCGAIIIEKLDEQRTKATNISDVDVGGSIPDFIKNALASKRVDILNKIEQIIKDNPVQ